MIADYDRANFSVSQAVFPNSSNIQQIVAIRRPDDLSSSTHNKQLSEDEIIGITTAAVVGFCIIIATVIRVRVRKRANRGGSEPGNGEIPTNQTSQSLEIPVQHPKELMAEEAQRPELPVPPLKELMTEEAQRPELPAQPSFPVHEMPQPTPELENAALARAHRD